MKKVVANPMELRDAIRCEKRNISITGGFAKMMQPLVTEKEVDVEKLDLPTFVKLALDRSKKSLESKTINIVFLS